MDMATGVKSNDERLLLRMPEAARSLGISRSLLYELVREGELPVIRIKGAVRISREVLQNWVRLQNANVTPASH